MARVCYNCGVVMNDTDRFCPACGASAAFTNQTPVQPQYTPQQPQYVPQQPQYEQPQYTPQQPQYEQQPQYIPQQPQYTPQYNQSYHTQQPTLQNTDSQLPMKWFKFVINFQLFAAVVLNVGLAGMMFGGLHYGDDAQLVYRYIPDLQMVDMGYGALLVISAILALVARFRLSKYRSNGPAMYYVYLGLQIVLPIIYIVATNAVISQSIIANYYEPDFTSNYSSIGSSLAMLACNITYFTKRKHLFVN